MCAGEGGGGYEVGEGGGSKCGLQAASSPEQETQLAFMMETVQHSPVQQV